MDPYKSSKLGNAIQRALGQLLQTAVKDPRVGLVTIHGVELNRDHTVARVFWSVMGDEEERRRSLAGLRQARGFLQGRLAGSLRLRQVPELRFVRDDSLERGLAVDSILRDLERQGELEGEPARRRRLTLEDLEPPRDLMAALCRPRRFWLVPHENPDPDAMGSALALAMALRALGAEARVFAYPDPPSGFAELPGYDTTTPADEAAGLLADEPPEVVVLVDSHRPDRTGPLAGLLEGAAEVWAVDHHLTTRRQAPVPGWIDQRACSASVLVYRIIATMAAGADGLCEPIELDVDMGTCIYAGLVGDTGGFRFPNTAPFCFELGRRLAELGVDTAGISRATLHRYRRQGIELLKEALATLTFGDGGRVAVMRVDLAMLARTGAVMSDTEGFVNLATSVEGVRYVAFMKQVEADTWRVSLRAPGGGDVQAVAARHGGGGHRQASGCTLSGDADEVAALLMRELQAQD